MSANSSAGAAWQALRRHHDQIADTTLRELFAEDPDRGRDLTLTVGDLYIDYSKHRVTRETLTLLVDLARAAGYDSFAVLTADPAGGRARLTEAPLA